MALEELKKCVECCVRETELYSYCIKSSYCKDCPQKDNPYCTETVMSELVEKIEKYSWHDLRKNPNDLPNVYLNSILCVNLEGQYLANCMLHFDKKSGEFDAETNREYIGNVIAWKEIEPFTEE